MPEITKCPVCKETVSRITRVLNKDSFYITCFLCGEYETTSEFIKLTNDELLHGKRFILSGILRNTFRNGKIELVMLKNYESIIESANLPKNPIETIERILLFIYEKMGYKSISEVVKISIEKDFPIFYLKSKTDFDCYLNEMKILGYIIGDNQNLKITLNGWKKIEELNKFKTDSDQAFVAMRFHESMNNAYKLGIEPALIETGFHPYRVDIDLTVKKIDDSIIAEIRRSGLLIADFTENRPAVYFEAGFAMGLGVPIIWTCRDDCVKDLCFDTRQYPHIKWKKESELKEQLVNRIEANFPGRLRAKVKK